MKFPISWLRKFANPQMDNDDLAKLLTMSGLEIETIEKFGNSDENIIIAEILEVRAHPSANKLNICSVNTGNEILSIVCGAPNVCVGLKAPLAKIGAKILGKEITHATIRGVASQGMLCSASELELSGIEDIYPGLLPLPTLAPVGKKLAEVFPTVDTIFTVKLTPNRGDCLSIIGLAREVAALTNCKFNVPTINENLFMQPEHTDTVAVEITPNNFINDQDPCEHYYGCVVSNINLQATTPLFMQLRLVQCGERPIHPLVDITNFIMLETGQPMHAFDRNKVGKIGVRFYDKNIDKGEFKLLNDETRKLAENILLITSDNKPVAVAGVMGGAESAINISENTLSSTLSTAVFFESAHFNPNVIQGRAKLLEVSSSAAYRFERGVDPNMSKFALNRACELSKEFLAGNIGALCFAKSKHNNCQSPAINFRLAKARRLIGYPYTADVAEAALLKLGFGVVKKNIEEFLVTPPSWRFDIEIEEDLIEEVARLVGYDNVGEEMPQEQVSMPSVTELNYRSPNTNWINISKSIANFGFQEVNTFGFVSEKLDSLFKTAEDYQPIFLSNPIAENLNVMRCQLIGSLIENCSTQVRNGQKTLRSFEIARVFNFNQNLENTINTNINSINGKLGNYCQPYHLAMLIWGLAYPFQWAQDKRQCDFFDLKGIFANIFPRINFEFKSFTKNLPTFLHPSRSAEILIDKKVVGFIGECHPQIARNFDLPSSPIILECVIAELTNTNCYKYQEINRLPIIERDLSLSIPKNVDKELIVAEIIDDIIKQGFANLQEVIVFDVYNPIIEKNTNVLNSLTNMDNSKKIALRFIIQAQNKTLTDEEINGLMQQIINRIKTRWNINLR